MEEKVKIDLNEWRNRIIARGSEILKGLRAEEKFDLMRMTVEMLKMQIQNDRRFNNGMEAPCSYLWESHLSILGIMVSMIFPSKFKVYEKNFNSQRNSQSSHNPHNAYQKIIFEILLSLAQKNPEVEESEVILEAKRAGIEEVKAKMAIDKLITNSILYRPCFSKLKFV